jgi:hypothetical protein
MVVGFMVEIVVRCHRTRARLFERSSRDENPSPLLDDDAFLPFQGKGVDSSASSACYALLRMRPLSIPCAECSVAISCGKVDYDKSG